MISLMCGVFKNDTNELTCKTEIDRPRKLMVTNGERWGGGMHWD